MLRLHVVLAVDLSEVQVATRCCSVETHGTKSLKDAFEIIEENVVCETFENERQFPVRVYAVSAVRI